MTELPGLDGLVRLTNVGGDHRNRVLKPLEPDRGGKELADEIQSTGLAAIGDLRRKVASARHSEIRAGRVGNQQIPSPVEHIQHIALDVFTFGFGWQQVTADGIEPGAGQSITDATGELAGY